MTSPTPDEVPDLDAPGTGEPAGVGALTFPTELTARVSAVKLLAVGRQSRVYRGVLDASREVVVKVFEAPSGPALAEYHRVCTLWRWTKDSYVVPLLFNGFAADSPTAYEVTDYLPDETLDRFVRATGPVDDSRARLILTQVGAALRHIHQELPGTCLIHRDIKPANLFVSWRGDDLHVRLGDFGSAMEYRPDHWTEDPPSFTRRYAAPEVFRKRAEPASDWWSLGITMHELLIGRHPLKDLPDNEDEVEHRMSQPAPEGLELVGEQWRDPIRGFWQRDIPYRWTYAKVKRWLEGGNPTVNQRYGPDEFAGRPFEFAGTTVRWTSDLATAMTRNWAEAADLVISYRWQEVVRWAGTVSTGLSRRLDEIGDALRFPGGLDRVVAEVIWRLDAFAEPTFRGEPIDRSRLAAFAVAARRGDARAAAFVRLLFDSGALLALSRLERGEGLEVIEERWKSWAQLARTRAAEALGSLDRLPSPDTLVAMLLGAAVDPEQARGLADEAEDRLNRRTKRVSWFAGFARAAVDGVAPAYHALMILTCDLALRPEHRASSDAREYAEAQYQLAVRRRLGPDRPRGTGRPPSGKPGGVAVSRRRPARRLADRAGVVLPVLGHVGLSVAAGVGVAAGTTPVEGVCVGGVLLAGGGCFWLASVARETPATNGVLAAAVGSVAGLVLSAAGGLAAALLVGPVVAWPVFWGAWVATTVAVGLVGARH